MIVITSWTVVPGSRLSTYIPSPVSTAMHVAWCAPNANLCDPIPRTDGTDAKSVTSWSDTSNFSGKLILASGCPAGSKKISEGIDGPVNSRMASQSLISLSA